MSPLRSLVAAGRLRGRGVLEQNPRQEDEAPRLPEGDRFEGENLGHEPVPQEVGGDGTDDTHEREVRDRENADTDTKCKFFQPVHFDLLKVLFSDALLRQRLTVFQNSDNTTNIAYMSLKVKRNRKSPYFRAFSRFLYWIKKFSSPKMRNRQFPACRQAGFLPPKLNTN